MRFLLVVSCLSLIGFGAFAQSASSPSAAKLEADGKFKDAAVAYKAELMKATGADQKALIKKIVDIDPDLPHLDGLLRSIATTHTVTEVREQAWAALGHLAIATSRLSEARTDFRTAYDLGHRSERLLMAAAIGLYLGNLETVRQEIEILVGLNPATPIMQKTILLSALYLVQKERLPDAWNLLDSQVLSQPEAPAEALVYGAFLAEQMHLADRAAALKADLTKRYAGFPMKKPADSSVAFALLAGSFGGLGPAPVAGVPLAAAPVKSTVTAAPVQTPALAAKTGDVGSKTVRAIQVGLYVREENAKAYVERLRVKAKSLSFAQEREGDGFRVVVPVNAKDDPDAILVQLKEVGVEGFLLF